MQRTGASIADEIRALGLLEPADEDTRKRILAMLHGVAPEHVGENSPAPPPAPRVEPGVQAHALDVSSITVPAAVVASEPPAPTFPPPTARQPGSPPPPPPPSSRASLANVTLVKRLPRVQAVPAPGSTGPGTASAAGERAPPRAPILAARHARAVLKLLAANIGEANAIDLPRLIARIARGQPVIQVPHRRALTVRRGVQLLIDWGAAMAPLAPDRDDVNAGLVRLLGPDRIQTLGFAGCPIRRTGTGARRSWSPCWQEPVRGVPVIVISDTGLAGSILDDDWASPSEWARFAAAAQANGSPVVILSPFGPDRWPVELLNVFTWVPWSETLSAAQLNRIQRDAASRGA